MIDEVILEIRCGDMPQMSEEEYIEYVKSHIVMEPVEEIEHALITKGGEVIGYTGRLTQNINIHYLLSSLIGCDPDEAIKIRRDECLMWETPGTEVQGEKFREVIEKMKYPIFELGSGKYFSKGKIKQMDDIMLWKNLKV